MAIKKLYGRNKTGMNNKNKQETLSKLHCVKTCDQLDLGIGTGKPVGMPATTRTRTRGGCAPVPVGTGTGLPAGRVRV